MHPALWISKTGLDAQQTQMSVISNNLANVNTNGYKRGRAVFEDLLYQTVRQPGGQSSQDTELPSGMMMGTGVRASATQKIFSVGGVIQTENPLDFAVNGRGFFQVLRPDGSLAYSRDGQLQMDQSGQLVTSSGFALSDGITIPSGAESITVGSDGTVSVKVFGNSTPTNVGSIQLADFVNPAGLQPIGQNLYSATAASGDAQTGAPGTNGMGTLLQGSLESSNVNIVEEMVNMIQTQRAYEMNSKVIAAVDGMLQFANQTL